MGMKELCKESESNPTERHSFFILFTTERKFDIMAL
jgi:hypothetical protein